MVGHGRPDQRDPQWTRKGTCRSNPRMGASQSRAAFERSGDCLLA